MGETVARLYRQHLRRTVERGAAASPDRRLFDFVSLRASDQTEGEEDVWIGSRPYPTLKSLTSLQNRYDISDI